MRLKYHSLESDNSLYRGKWSHENYYKLSLQKDIHALLLSLEHFGVRFKALVIDNDQRSSKKIEATLTSLNHDYDIARCQKRARDLIRQKYSYILLDIDIPVATGHESHMEYGINLLQEIKALREHMKILKDTPVIVMTNHEPHDIEFAVSVMRLGADDFVSKPLSKNGRSLNQAISEALVDKKPLATVDDPKEEKKLVEVDLKRRSGFWHWLVDDKDKGRLANSDRTIKFKLGRILFERIGQLWTPHRTFYQEFGWSEQEYFGICGNSGKMHKHLHNLRRQLDLDIYFRKAEGVMFPEYVVRPLGESDFLTMLSRPRDIQGRLFDN